MTAGWTLHPQSFLLPKDGSSQAECEDCLAANQKSGTFAIADGATEAFDSKTWAKLLVRRWTRTVPAAFALEDLHPLVRDLGLILHQHWRKKKLPWYAEEKASAGSFAAFLGAEFRTDTNPLHWRAVALGDCCLVHMRGDDICTAFPISDPGHFGMHPVLLPSSVFMQPDALNRLNCSEGDAFSGDEFWLLSDAVADCFLRHEESRATLRGCMDTGNSEIAKLITELRSVGRMRNDDVAIVRIKVSLS